MKPFDLSPFTARAESRGASVKPPRARKCKACRQSFAPWRPLQQACSPECAIELGKSKTAKQAEEARKAERKEIRVRKEKIKRRADWLKEAQAVFNAFVRERDKGQPCICCGQPLTLDAVGGGYDCGHYRSTGSAPHLRFNEDNAHAQRKHCNRHRSGNAVDYRIGLIARIGLARVEALEADQAERKYTIGDLKAIRDEYRAKLKDLKRETVK